MITKLTAQNAELYYAPRFAQITEAFAAAGKSIVIKSLEDYFNNLTEIAQLYVDYVDANNPGVRGAFLLVAPADEEVFAIDANTRAINVPNSVKKNGIGVYGDHRAEMIIFTIDRYFDHEDLLTDKIAINWNFTESGSRTPKFETPKAQAAFAPNGELNPGKVTFGFIITKEMTPAKGTLTFSVTIYDNDSNEITYSFNTLTASVGINDTLTLLDVNVVEDDSENYFGRLSNSVYNDGNIAPVGTPVWQSGYKLTEDDIVSGLKKNDMSGLNKIAYLPETQDLANDYSEGIALQAISTVNPGTADITYKWTYAPINGTVEMGRNFNSAAKYNDFIERELPNADDGLVYYRKDAMGRIITTEAYSWDDAKDLLEEDDTLVFYVHGTSFKAQAAGSYQAHAQARISVGEQYEKVLEGATLKAGKEYFIKVNGEIDDLHPLLNEDALAAQEEGKELYVLVSAARNSKEVDSVVLTIPAAVKPEVALSVASTYQFDNEINRLGDSIIKEVTPDETSGILEYVYIDNDRIPDIQATVTINSEDNQDKAGAIAVELMSSDSPELDLNTINSEIEANKIAFRALGNGKFNVVPESITEGEYVVRAINRRNATYSVSEPSKKMLTSFVAPVVSNINITAAIDGQNIPVLVNGLRPADSEDPVELPVSRIDPLLHYDIIDNTTDNYADAVTSYFLEEVDYQNGVIIPRDLDAAQSDEQADNVEIIMNGNAGSFEILKDAGFYRIRIENRYHGTLRTHYSDLFTVKSYGN